MEYLTQEPALRKILGKVEIETIIKRLKGEKLKQTERNYLSRSIKPKLIAARLLAEERLLEKMNKGKENLDKAIQYNLSKYGYELILEKRIKKQRILPIEELICLILTRKPEPRYIEAIPIIMLKNKIDKFKIAETAAKYKIKNKIGYLLETASLIAKRTGIENDFEDIIGHLKSNNEKTSFLGEEKDELYTDFLLKTSPIRIKKWNLLGRFFDQDFFKNAGNYL